MEVSKRKEPKRKFALWVKESSLDLVRKLYKEDNCSSQSEFIEKAILFYAGYLSTEDNKSYLPNVVTSTLKGIVAESDNRQNRMMFKLLQPYDHVLHNAFYFVLWQKTVSLCSQYGHNQVMWHRYP